MLSLAVLPSPARAADPSTPALPPVAAQVPYTPGDLAALGAALDAALASAQVAADSVTRAAIRDIAVQRALDAAAEQVDAAQGALGEQVRTAYMRGPVDPINAMVSGLMPYDLALATHATAAKVGVDAELVSQVGDAKAALADLQQRTSGRRSALVKRALVAQAAFDQARSLLASARAAYAANQAVLAQLNSVAAMLDSSGQAVAFAVAPAVTARGRDAAAAEAPVVAALESVPYGQLPQGFGETGQSISGIASWYGPGFVGSPTSSGAPYDPERLTAAMLVVPLGTVVRVTSLVTGRSVCVLVNDHGPYVAGRVIDLSHAAAGAIGVSLGPVRVDILARA